MAKQLRPGDWVRTKYGALGRVIGRHERGPRCVWYDELGVSRRWDAGARCYQTKPLCCLHTTWCGACLLDRTEPTDEELAIWCEATLIR